MIKKLRKYIYETRRITISEAARELGCTRVHLSNVVNGNSAASRKFAREIQKWSRGAIKASEVLGVR